MALEGLNYFSYNPVDLNIKRSMFNRSHQKKTTFNAGKLIPIMVDEIYPGDTVTLGTSFVVRGATPIAPVMDNAYADIYWFFVPNRLVWTHWKEFMGENTDSYWYPYTEKEIPHLSFYNSDPAGEIKLTPGDLLDYLGIPSNVNLNGVDVNALPVRAYCLIWNEWFRDQATQAPTFVPTGDDNYLVGSGYPYKGVDLLPVNKFHDYFTSCLPAPQKGPAISLPLGEFAPLVSIDPNNETVLTPDLINQTISNISFQSPNFGVGANRIDAGSKVLVTDLHNATAATINQLREAFALQHLLETDALGGTRYTEIIRAHFGVTSPDSRQQRPECLGGCRIPINQTQVPQTSSSDNTTPQGNVAAFSLTAEKNKDRFTKSFTEHGYLIGLVCVRTEHTYQQGIEKMWSRKRRFDFYFPALANLGEQPVLNKEIFASNDVTVNEQVFGYQEAWADLRYKPSGTSGYMRSTVSGSLDVWHYGDDFESCPVLNSDFMKETQKNIDRTLAVQSDSAHQFIADFYFDYNIVRPMPVRSIPGVLGHN